MQLIGLNKAFAEKKAVIKQKGFTLIELMIVVAIIGVLAAIAMPQYNKYVARTQVAEAFALLGPVKQALTLYYQENGKLPGPPNQADALERHNALGVATSTELAGDYVRHIIVGPNLGWTRVKFFNTAPVNDLIKDKMFELRPTISAGVITSWACYTKAGTSTWIDDVYVHSCN